MKKQILKKNNNYEINKIIKNKIKLVNMEITLCKNKIQILSKIIFKMKINLNLVKMNNIRIIKI